MNVTAMTAARNLLSTIAVQLFVDKLGKQRHMPRGMRAAPRWMKFEQWFLWVHSSAHVPLTAEA
jgi:hypothetical protein